MDASGQTKAARADLERALAIAKTTGSASQRVRALMTLGSVTATEGRLADAQQIASGAVDDALREGLDTVAAEGLISLGATLADRKQYDEAADRLDQAVKLAEGRGARRVAAAARVQLAEARRLQGQPEAALKIVDEVLPFVHTNQYPRLELRALLIAGRAHNDLDQTDQAGALAAQALSVAEAVHDNDSIAVSSSELAGTLTGAGDYARALPLRERAEALYRSLGDHRSLPYALVNHADVLIRLGRRKEAEMPLAELDAGIARKVDMYVDRAKRAAFLRAYAAATAMRCDEMRGPLAAFGPSPPGAATRALCSRPQ